MPQKKIAHQNIVTVTASQVSSGPNDLIPVEKGFPGIFLGLQERYANFTNFETQNSLRKVRSARTFPPFPPLRRGGGRSLFRLMGAAPPQSWRLIAPVDRDLCVRAERSPAWEYPRLCICGAGGELRVNRLKRARQVGKPKESDQNLLTAAQLTSRRHELRGRWRGHAIFEIKLLQQRRQ